MTVVVVTASINIVDNEWYMYVCSAGSEYWSLSCQQTNSMCGNSFIETHQLKNVSVSTVAVVVIPLVVYQIMMHVAASQPVTWVILTKLNMTITNNNTQNLNNTQKRLTCVQTEATETNYQVVDTPFHANYRQPAVVKFCIYFYLCLRTLLDTDSTVIIWSPFTWSCRINALRINRD